MMLSVSCVGFEKHRFGVATMAIASLQAPNSQSSSLSSFAIESICIQTRTKPHTHSFPKHPFHPHKILFHKSTSTLDTSLQTTVSVWGEVRANYFTGSE